MKQLYKYGNIKVLTEDELKKFNYDNYFIKQIENIGYNIYAVEVLKRGEFIDTLKY